MWQPRLRLVLGGVARHCRARRRAMSRGQGKTVRMIKFRCSGPAIGARDAVERTISAIPTPGDLGEVKIKSKSEPTESREPMVVAGVALRLSHGLLTGGRHGL